MRGKRRLTVAVLLALSTTIISCGDSGKSSAADSPAPTTHRQTPHTNSTKSHHPQQTNTTRPQTINAHFTPRSRTLVEGSVLRLGENTGSPYISNGYSVHPLNREQQAKIQSMLQKTNNYRRQYGLAPLQYDPRLGAYAYVRADEIRGKYSHQRPNGTKFHSGLTIGNGWKGENLDASRESAAETFNAWVGSKEHRENLLNRNFTRIGIAYVYDPNSRRQYHWAQIFASGDLSTPYHFDAAMSKTTLPEMEGHLQGKVQLRNGQIALTGGQQSTADHAGRARRAGQLSHNIYNAARHYSHNGYDAVIQEPAGVFSYQTFGEVVDPNREPVQYLNIGQPTIPAANANFQATYRGASVGNLNKQSHVYADVIADVNFRDSKTMDLRFGNSKIAYGDIANRNPAQGLSNAATLDFAERLQWNASQGRFTGNTTSANFYGPAGEEIGGQFARQTQSGIYQGAFGLRKVQ